MFFLNRRGIHNIFSQYKLGFGNFQDVDVSKWMSTNKFIVGKELMRWVKPSWTPDANLRKHVHAFYNNVTIPKIDNRSQWSHNILSQQKPYPITTMQYKTIITDHVIYVDLNKPEDIQRPFIRLKSLPQIRNSSNKRFDT